jgi:hypothetical protein
VKWFRRIAIGLSVLGVLGFLAIQLVPYGRNHTNPPVVREPIWPSPEVRALAKRACFDCHSNEVVWPWYSNVAPVSWMIQRDVDEGRRKLNFSEWGTRRDERDAAEQVQQGKMPEPKYLLTHPEARLTNAEKQMLIDGLQAIAGRR